MSKGLIHEILQDVLRIKKELRRFPSRVEYEKHGGKYSQGRIKSAFGEKNFGGWPMIIKLAAPLEEPEEEDDRKPKILIFDIETAPIIAYVWSIWEENVGLNQIKSDWHLLSWAAKWSHEDKVMYMDQRGQRNIEDDSEILKGLWNLLNEADVVVGQNIKSFDVKKVNARFAMAGLSPPSPYKIIDTRNLAKKHFSFTSTKLEYLSDKLCTKYKKLSHKEFPGFELWRECLKGNKSAWRELETYNRHDVLATEELYQKLAPWGTGIDLNVFRGEPRYRCQCGSGNLQSRGHTYSTTGKYRRFQCKDCGAWSNARGLANNLMTKRKKESLKDPAS